MAGEPLSGRRGEQREGRRRGPVPGPAEGEGDGEDPPRSVRRDELLGMLTDESCLDLLGLLLEEDRPMSVQEIAEQTGEPATAVYRRLQGMAETPLVDRRLRVDTDGLNQPEYETWRVQNYEAIRRAVEQDVEEDLEER